MFTNFFEARDALDRAILGDEIELAIAALAIFRFLLSHAFYNEQSYGFVNHKVCGIDTIAKLTGCSPRTVKRALPELEAARLIHRRPRPLGTGGKRPDEITIIWPVFHAEDEDGAESANLSDEGASLSTEGADLAPSFLDKKVKTTTSTSDGDVAGKSPSGKTRSRAKASSRSRGTARSSSTRVKDDCPVDDSPAPDEFPDLEEYVSDIEKSLDILESLLSMEPGQINVKVWAQGYPGRARAGSSSEAISHRPASRLGP